jgi:RNA polymerase sigma-70 factor, ECF subfamily
MEQTRSQRFEEMFRENYAAVRGYALRRTSPEAAQDAVAETFLVAWRRFDDMPDDSLPWLFGVARRVLANQRRSSARGDALERKLAATTPPEHLEESVTESEVVRAALARLSERDREALMLVAWHGLSGKRAARVAGCTRAAFDVRLHRARRRLAAQLKALDPSPVAANAVEAS